MRYANSVRKFAGLKHVAICLKAIAGSSGPACRNVKWEDQRIWRFVGALLMSAMSVLGRRRFSDVCWRSLDGLEER